MKTEVETSIEGQRRHFATHLGERQVRIYQ